MQSYTRGPNESSKFFFIFHINHWDDVKWYIQCQNRKQNIIFHCRGGKGRAGTVAAILLADFGHEKKEAIDLVRERRKGAIETKIQEEFILNYNIYKWG